MKKILFLAGIMSLLSTSGCILADGHRGHARYEHQGDVVVRPVEVVPPEVVVRPPEIIVR